MNNNDESGQYIKHTYDHIFDGNLYNTTIEEDVPPIYNSIYTHIKNQSPDEKIVFTSKDINVNVPIISAVNELYMYQEGQDFRSNLKLVIFDNNPRVNIYHKKDDNVMASLLGLTDNEIHINKLLLKPNQIIYVGIDDSAIDVDQIQMLDDYGIIYFTLSTIKKKGINNILNYILEEIKNEPLFTCINSDCAKNGMLSDDNIVNNIIKCLGGKSKYLSITNYNDIDRTQNILKYIKILLTGLMDIKEKKINIFSENSKFLIYREVEPIADNDNGWYILRFLDNDTKEKILEKLCDDDIITFTFEDDDGEEIDILISSTTVEEQEMLSYNNENDDVNDIYDRCLYPIEKYSMIFELIN